MTETAASAGAAVLVHNGHANKAGPVGLQEVATSNLYGPFLKDIFMDINCSAEDTIRAGAGEGGQRFFDFSHIF